MLNRKLKIYILCLFVFFTIFISGCNKTYEVSVGETSSALQSTPRITTEKTVSTRQHITESDSNKSDIDERVPDETKAETSNKDQPKKTDDISVGQPVENQIREIDGFVLLESVDKNIVIDLKYATKDNFTKQKVYPNNICALRKETAVKLAKANAEFMKLGLRIKIWDAYRPIYVQRIFWDILPDSRYVANPNNGGSKHNKGTAVDITLVDKNGNELEMPSKFDDFTYNASRLNNKMSDKAKKNLKLLTDIMVENGFTTINSEWWHFNDSNSAKYQMVDVNLEEFNKINDKNSSTRKVSTTDNKTYENDGYQYIGMLDKIKKSKQIVLILSNEYSATAAKAYVYEKNNGKWKQVFKPFDAVIGKNGFTYNKVEGDKKSPIGTFPVKRCFSRVDNPGTKLDFTKFNENDFWVDDPNTVYYNTYQKGLPKGRWSSAEDLYKIGYAYKYFIVIEYNTENPIRGKGSAIFLHIWKGKGSYTAGCTAMAEDNLLRIINRLDPSKNPILIQGPESEILKLLPKGSE